MELGLFEPIEQSSSKCFTFYNHINVNINLFILFQQSIQSEAAAPKRSWPFFPSSRPVVALPSKTQYCQCYPYSSYPYPYPSNPIYTAQEEGHSQQPSGVSNVRQVVPSDDHHGLASETITKTVPAPQQNGNVQLQPNLAIKPQQQANGQNNEQLTVQQQHSQQVPFVPYQNSGITYTTNNANSQTLPGNTNFQSPSGDAVQNGQLNN